MMLLFPPKLSLVTDEKVLTFRLQVSTQIFLRLVPDVGLEEGLGVAEAVGVDDDDDGRIFLS